MADSSAVPLIVKLDRTRKDRASSPGPLIFDREGLDLDNDHRIDKPDKGKVPGFKTVPNFETVLCGCARAHNALCGGGGGGQILRGINGREESCRWNIHGRHKRGNASESMP